MQSFEAWACGRTEAWVVQIPSVRHDQGGSIWLVLLYSVIKTVTRDKCNVLVAALFLSMHRIVSIPSERMNIFILPVDWMSFAFHRSCSFHPL